MTITLIKFTAIRSDERLTLARHGDRLTVNGDTFDFSFLSEGDSLPADAVDSAWFKDDVERVDGVLRVTLALPHGADAPAAARFPAPLRLTCDGPVALPGHAGAPAT